MLFLRFLFVLSLLSSLEQHKGCKDIQFQRRRRSNENPRVVAEPESTRNPIFSFINSGFHASPFSMTRNENASNEESLFYRVVTGYITANEWEACCHAGMFGTR